MKRNKTIKIFGIIFVVAALLIFINFIPTLSLRTSNMHLLEGEWVNVYYEGEEGAAKDVFQLANARAGELAKKLGFSEKQNINIYIYDHQSTMQMKKYGLIGPMLGLDWYFGDNIGTDVILTSPANPGKVNDYDINKQGALHEMVHAYVSIINPHIRLWLTEGMALYLSNAEPFYKRYTYNMHIPTFSEIKTSNPVKFSKMGGYTFANTYIEYIDKKYGWEKLMQIIKTEDYETVFGKSDEDIYNEWVNYIKNYYQ
ncbi:hypothetical protein [Clostridium sp.]|uniref:hypothetical protein n=1 Tax=Clostridium sp. TaxID=1506 RepID=UPI00262BC748|nr:hypothetical protein [Clostridium sp.]